VGLVLKVGRVGMSALWRRSDAQSYPTSITLISLKAIALIQQ